MRLLPIAFSLAVAAATMASAGHGQRPDDQIDPQSVALVEQARGLSAAGQHNEAIDLLETALAIDPRNRGAYIALGRVGQPMEVAGAVLFLASPAASLITGATLLVVTYNLRYAEEIETWAASIPGTVRIRDRQMRRTLHAQLEWPVGTQCRPGDKRDA